MQLTKALFVVACYHNLSSAVFCCNEEAVYSGLWLTRSPCSPNTVSITLAHSLDNMSHHTTPKVELSSLSGIFFHYGGDLDSL
ncbi:hypothetical protein V1522DRAFT_402697 [Lipomyces starkeyi]